MMTAVRRFFYLLQRVFSKSYWNLSVISTDNFSHCRLVPFNQLVQFPQLFEFHYFSIVHLVSISLIRHLIYLGYYNALVLINSELLDTDDVIHRLCCARGFIKLRV